ncbi:MAG: ribosome assembly RNA-binding protein YhbY [Haliea sp.]|uniref:ribosome assembly RNA-binding protein YhbY n=1 Tax=Haliea sp. TaxID=1932666 RepID=UPI0032EB5991
MSKKASLDHRQLRAIGHKLKPVVTVAGNGLSDNVLQEVRRALGDHELIKVKIAVGDRDTRASVTEALCAETGATLVQSIGNIVLLLKRAKQPDPRLSNLMRALS